MTLTIKQKIIKALVEQPDHVLTTREIFDRSGHRNSASVAGNIYHLRDEGLIDKIETARGPAWRAVMHEIREPTCYLHSQVEDMVHEILKYTDFSSEDLDNIASTFKMRFKYLKGYELRSALRLLGRVGEFARDLVDKLIKNNQDAADPAEPAKEPPVPEIEPVDAVEPVNE